MIVNAEVTSTQLGPDERGHGILTCSIGLKFGPNEAQAFGGYNLTQPGELHRWINGLLRVTGARSWEDMKGKIVRVDKKDTLGMIHGVGHVLEDKWFYAKEGK